MMNYYGVISPANLFFQIMQFHLRFLTCRARSQPVNEFYVELQKRFAGRNFAGSARVALSFQLDGPAYMNFMPHLAACLLVLAGLQGVQKLCQMHV